MSSENFSEIKPRNEIKTKSLASSGKPMNKYPKVERIYNDMWKFNVWYFKDWRRDSIKEYLMEVCNFTNLSDITSIEASVFILPLRVESKHDILVHEESIYCLYLPEPTNPGAIVHEVLHIVSRVLRERGVVLSEDSEEVYTYLAEWLCNEVSRLQEVPIVE